MAALQTAAQDRSSFYKSAEYQTLHTQESFASAAVQIRWFRAVLLGRIVLKVVEERKDLSAVSAGEHYPQHPLPSGARCAASRCMPLLSVAAAVALPTDVPLRPPLCSTCARAAALGVDYTSSGGGALALRACAGALRFGVTSFAAVAIYTAAGDRVIPHRQTCWRTRGGTSTRRRSCATHANAGMHSVCGGLTGEVWRATRAGRNRARRGCGVSLYAARAHACGGNNRCRIALDAPRRHAQHVLGVRAQVLRRTDAVASMHVCDATAARLRSRDAGDVGCWPVPRSLLFPVDLAQWTDALSLLMKTTAAIITDEDNSSWGKCCSSACMAQALHSTAVTQLYQLLFVVGSVFCRCC
eukprot:TRINITY_DN23462_c0_g1_i1.p1 TRINITY_DN23462_c0_g1~~TRINITY_DN23462_c0_g1_i1.p1  ORF type:complete len:356 (-),score=35.81 TRINITY_DN23462_c0_g1_i1:405-1472(-)